MIQRQGNTCRRLWFGNLSLKYTGSYGCIIQLLQDCSFLKVGSSFGNNPEKLCHFYLEAYLLYNLDGNDSKHPLVLFRLKCPRSKHLNLRRVASQISEGWCLFVNAAARNAVGTLSVTTSLNVDWFDVPVKLPWRVLFCCFLSIYDTVFTETFLTVLPINQQYVGKNQTMTLPKMFKLGQNWNCFF